MKGFPSQQKLGNLNHATITPLGSDKHGIDMAPKAIFPVTGIPLAIVSSAMVKDTAVVGMEKGMQQIEITAHGARKGDVLRFDSGPLIGMEAPIIRVLDANNVAIPFNIGDATTSTCLLMRYITLTLDSSGSLSVSSGPVQYNIDNIANTVNVDTAAPENTLALPTEGWYRDENGAVEIYRDSTDESLSKPLPSLNYFIKDGVTTPINLDTVTPANTQAIPVSLVDITGVPASINVTTGDLNVALSHDGIQRAWDSSRIGDGANLWLMNATGEGLVKDTDVETQLVALNAKVVAHDLDTGAGTENAQGVSLRLSANGGSIEAKGQQLSADSIPVVLPSDQTVSVDTTGLSTEAKQDTQITALGSLLTELQAKADLTETQPVSAASLPLPTGAATEAKQDAEIVELTAIKTAVELLDNAVNGTRLNTGLESIAAAYLGRQAEALGQSVTLSTEDKAVLDNINAGISSLAGAGLQPIGQVVVDMSVNNIPNGSRYVAIADIGATAAKKIHVFMQTGEPVWVSEGATRKLIVPSGGMPTAFEIDIAANGSLELEAYSTLIDSGLMTINLWG